MLSSLPGGNWLSFPRQSSHSRHYYCENVQSPKLSGTNSGVCMTVMNPKVLTPEFHLLLGPHTPPRPRRGRGLGTGDTWKLPERSARLLHVVVPLPTPMGGVFFVFHPFLPCAEASAKRETNCGTGLAMSLHRARSFRSYLASSS